MLKCLKIYLIAILFLSIFSFASLANAQVTTSDIQVSVTPQYPQAGSPVAIHLQSYTIALDQANISWVVAGKVVNKGYGLADFSTTAGQVGSILKITAVITTTSGTINKIITIQPADISLLWQATSYVPPFYQGKAIYPSQGLIKFTAIPNLSSTKSITKTIGTYIYTWKKDGDVLGNFSGYGKDTFTLRGTIIPSPFNIEVDVSSLDGTSLGAATVSINPSTPKVLFYQNDPLLGVLYNQSLSNYNMQGKELSISAVPLFFNTGGEPSDLQYNWTMNGQSISSQSDPSSLTIRNDTGTSGNSTIGLQITNTLKVLQTASNSMSITFGQTNQTNL